MFEIYDILPLFPLFQVQSSLNEHNTLVLGKPSKQAEMVKSHKMKVERCRMMQDDKDLTFVSSNSRSIHRKILHQPII